MEFIKKTKKFVLNSMQKTKTKTFILLLYIFKNFPKSQSHI